MVCHPLLSSPRIVRPEAWTSSSARRCPPGLRIRSCRGGVRNGSGQQILPDPFPFASNDHTSLSSAIDQSVRVSPRVLLPGRSTQRRPSTINRPFFTGRPIRDRENFGASRVKSGRLHLWQAQYPQRRQPKRSGAWGLPGDAYDLAVLCARLMS